MGRWLSSGRECERMVDAAARITVSQKLADIETSHTETVASVAYLKAHDTQSEHNKVFLFNCNVVYL